MLQMSFQADFMAMSSLGNEGNRAVAEEGEATKTLNVLCLMRDMDVRKIRGFQVSMMGELCQRVR